MSATQQMCSAWRVEVFAPFPESAQVLFGRVAARSAAFGRTSASGGGAVLIGSAAGHDPQDVALRARGELLERMSNVLAGRVAEAAGTVVATFEQLRRRRAPAVDPAHWGGREARDASQLWVAGQSLLTGAETLVPAGVTFLHHRPPNGCQAMARAGSTGVAAHPDATVAADHAAWEIFERDLVRRSWYNGGPAPTVMSGDSGLPAVLEQLLLRRRLPVHPGWRPTVLRCSLPTGWRPTAEHRKSCL
jgi:ribosomal protein S12 methylthiotransferase accessory factor